MSSVSQRTRGSKPSARHADRTARPHAACSGGITQSRSASGGQRPIARGRIRRRDKDQRLSTQVCGDKLVGQRQRHVIVFVHDGEIDVVGGEQVRAARRFDTITVSTTPGFLRPGARAAGDTTTAAALATVATDTGPVSEPAMRSRSARAAASTSSTLSGPRAERVTGTGEDDAAGRAVEQRGAGLPLEHHELL